MFEYTTVKVSPTTRASIKRMCTAHNDQRGLNEVVEAALQAWLQQQAIADPAAARATARGYQWKSLFLPEGTQLRCEYRHNTYYADVRGDRIYFEGRSYSPRALMLHLTGTVRNAWRELWIRSPGDFRWHLADTRRHILRRTPRGLHPHGADQPLPNAPKFDERAGAAPISLELLAQDQRFQLVTYLRLRRDRLYRDDLVRADQPDLHWNLGGGGRFNAGRAGPRDRRCSGRSFQFVGPGVSAGA